MMETKLAVLGGIRTPFCKAQGVLTDLDADDLGALVCREMLERYGVPDEVIFGNVVTPLHAANIARVIAQKATIPDHVVAHTVNRNCASGMEAIAAGCDKIRLGDAESIIAGGTESMTNITLGFSKKMAALLMKLSKAKTWGQRLKLLGSFRPKFLTPRAPALVDPVCGLSMGQTAEVLARDFHITRESQDAFALLSHQRAAAATHRKWFEEEILPIPLPPNYATVQVDDDGFRENQTLEALQRLRPVFDRFAGTVTAGTASQISDGAACLFITSEARAKNLKPLGYITGYAFAGLEGKRMGLGPTHATHKLLEKMGLRLDDFDLIEINEAFAAQVIANERAMASKEYCRKHLNREEAIGTIDRERLNIHGGAIALGHPIGASGARLILTLLRSLKEKNLKRGLATLCVGGGQGAAFCLER